MPNQRRTVPSVRSTGMHLTPPPATYRPTKVRRTYPALWEGRNLRAADRISPTVIVLTWRSCGDAPCSVRSIMHSRMSSLRWASLHRLSSSLSLKRCSSFASMDSFKVARASKILRSTNSGLLLLWILILRYRATVCLERGFRRVAVSGFLSQLGEQHLVEVLAQREQSSRLRDLSRAPRYSMRCGFRKADA